MPLENITEKQDAYGRIVFTAWFIIDNLAGIEINSFKDYIFYNKTLVSILSFGSSETHQNDQSDHMETLLRRVKNVETFPLALGNSVDVFIDYVSAGN